MAGGPNRWWGVAERGGTGRLEAFSDGVFAIAVTLLILDVPVDQAPGESLATALYHALPEIGAYVETEDGREIGRTRFEIRPDPGTDERIFEVLRN